MVKIVFLVALTAASLSVVLSCAPHQAYPQYQAVRAIQQPQPVYETVAQAPAQQTVPEPQPYQEVQPVQSVQTVESNEGHVVNEDVQVIDMGTTLIPVVKERVVQNVIKEVHNYPIQKKKIIKTKHISKPTVFEREYMERIPGTKIVPTFEERRATQIVRGTTMSSVVEESEVTEMLPELPVRVEQPKEQTSYETLPQAPVQQTGYETATPAAPVQQMGNSQY